MFPFSSIIPLIVLTLGEMLFNPVFWLVVLLIGLQYKRTLQLKERFFGLPGEAVWPDVVAATLYGLVGGFLGSLLLILAGVSLTEIGVTYLWVTAVLLMLISPRFLCFSYAGGLISLSSLAFGWPVVDVPQLMGLVAVLHLVESVLIRLSGHLGAVPIYLRNKAGKVAGAFNLHKFWPIPLVGLVLATLPPEAGGTIAMPDWWPLIKPGLHQVDPQATYVLIPVFAALGYSDLAMTCEPKQKSKRSAVELGIYSIILFFLSVLASNLRELALLPALFGPLAHEFLILRGQRSELQGQPLYVALDYGVKILSVVKNSPASVLGVKPGDIIISLNDQPVTDRFELARLLENNPSHIKIVIKRSFKNIHIEGYNSLDKMCGLITVPDPAEKNYLEITSKGYLAKLLKSLTKR